MSPVSFFAKIFDTGTGGKYEKYANKTGKLPETFWNSQEFLIVLISGFLVSGVGPTEALYRTLRNH